MLVHRRVTSSLRFAGTHFYTWAERGTVRVECLAQEHNTMSPAGQQILLSQVAIKYLFNIEHVTLIQI